MSKTLKIVLTILVIGLIAGLVTLKWVYRKADVSIGAKKAEITIDASILLNKFESNEDSANILYLNKIIQVSGTVDNITSNDQGISVYLKNSDEVAGIMCSFDKTVIDTTSVKRGERVTVMGICTGYLMDVVLNKCLIAKE